MNREVPALIRKSVIAPIYITTDAGLKFGIYNKFASRDEVVVNSIRNQLVFFAKNYEEGTT
jgi:hypothetical protein